LIIESARDGARRAKFFGHFREPRDLIHAKAELQKDVHLVERALSLPEPRKPFGEKPAARIQNILDHYGDDLGENLITQAKRVLEDRINWNESGIRPSPKALTVQTEIEEFLSSRRSIRAFSSDLKPKPIEIEEIVELAIQAPSVSNTQTWKVRSYQNPKDISALLKLQNGNVGNSEIPTLFLVSVDIRSFTGANERNQMWIDGGIFLQQLLLAIHAKGWASCPMNFSATNHQAATLRRLANIPKYEEIICFVSLGEEDKSIPAAPSHRKMPSEVLIFSDLAN